MALAVTVTQPAANFILAPGQERTTGGLVLIWGWLSMSFSAIGMIVTPDTTRNAEAGGISVRPPRPTRRRLLMAASACLAVGVLGCGGGWLLTVDQRPRAARWLRVQMDGEEKAVTTIRAAAEGGALATLAWQPGTETSLAIAVKGGGGDPAGLRVTAIEADGAAVDLSSITLAGARAVDGGLLLERPDAALFQWTRPSRRLRVCLAGGAADVRLFWHDQVADLRVNGTEACTNLALPAAAQGWLLLPPDPIAALTLELPPSATPYRIARVEILPASDEETIVTPAAWRANGCSLTGVPRDGGVATTAASACRVHVSLPTTLNAGSPAARRIGWGLLAAAIVLLLAASSAVQAWRWLGVWLQGVPGRPPSQWRWDLAAAAVIVALMSGGVYSVFLPTDFSNDSTTYYDLATAFLRAPGLASQTSFRTPGYPLFLALIRCVAGENVRAIILAQHLTLSLLAPLVVLTLSALGASGRLALAAGLAAAIMPATRPLGNMLWTDALFGSVAGAALLTYILADRTRRGQILAGVLAGLATMVRPNGLVLLLLFAGWSAGRELASGALWKRRAIRAAAFVLIGYLVTAGPWHLHLLLVRHTTDLSQGSKRFVVWLGGAAQNWIREDLPINLPHRAPWAASFAWGRDGWGLMARFPEVERWTDDRLLSDVYYAESIRQAERLRPWDVLRHRMGTAYFLLFLRVPPPAWLQVQTDLLWTLGFWGLPAWTEHRHVVEIPTKATLSAMAQPLYPAPSWTRDALRQLSLDWLAHWRWLALLALLGIPMVAWRPALRVLLLPALFWASQVASSAWIGWAIDRYLVIAEPLLYLLVAGGVAAWSYRRPHTVTEGEDGRVLAAVTPASGRP